MTLSRTAIWSAAAALALVAAALLARNAWTIGAAVPLDPNEGWNAAHAMAAMAGGALYPPPGALMVNNYPPLSFYLVGAAAKAGGDFIAAGRAVSLLAFLAVCGAIAAAARAMGAGARGAILAALFFAVLLLVASDYAGMDDPQLLGHAVQMAALLLLLRGRVRTPALLFAASLFLKHNLVALPLAAGAWLWLADRRAGRRFALWGAAAVLAGLAAFRLLAGMDLLSVLASPRRESLANVARALRGLWWALLPAAVLALLPRDRGRLFCLLYAGTALVLGLGFSAGDGVDANAFFDLGIALALALGLAAGQDRMLAGVAALPLLALLAFNFDDNNFFFTHAFAAQSRSDIGFLRAHPGPALCSQLSLCLWAGKEAAVDVFNVGEAIQAGARDPAPLVRLIQARHFAVLQLDDPAALGPAVRAAIARAYRVDHSGDNGVFLVPAR